VGRAGGWTDPARRVSLTSNQDATTTVVLVNRGLSEAELEDHRSGWQISFDNLDAVLQGGPDGAATIPCGTW
jgi:hypothetical protein